MSELIAVVAPVTVGAAGLQGGGEKYNEQRKKKSIGVGREDPGSARNRTQPNCFKI